MNFKFEEALTAEQLKDDFSLQSLIQLKPLLIRFRELTGTIFSRLVFFLIFKFHICRLMMN